MRLSEFVLFADENVHPALIQRLKERRMNVATVVDHALAGRPDSEILDYAFTRRWCVLTHDSDFGRLSIEQLRPFTGIVFVRPGHFLSPRIELAFDALLDTDPEVEPPFVVVLKARDNDVTIRVRSFPQR